MRFYEHIESHGLWPAVKELKKEFLNMPIPQRLGTIKLFTIIGIVFSLYMTPHLWVGQRSFPKVPLFEFLNRLSFPYDYINIVVLIILLVISLISRSKTALILLVLFCFYLCIDDQNRLQSWFYDYILILTVLIYFNSNKVDPGNSMTVFIILQILMALIYIFSGLQKLNPFFIENSFKWMITPLQNIFTESQMRSFYRFGKLAPYIEIFIGIGLLIRPTRFIALPLVIIMHIFIVLMLGPGGKSWNSVVWPWNILMVLLDLLLFANVEKVPSFKIPVLFKCPAFYIVIVLMFILPIFSFNNKYDSYLSNSLYSGNTNKCTLILSDRACNNLPASIKSVVIKNKNNNIMDIKNWALKEFNAPCVPEYRVFHKVQQYVIHLTNTDTNEVKMDFTGREKILGF